jgi:recombination protein RecA
MSLLNLKKGMSKAMKEEDYILLDSGDDVSDVSLFIPTGCTSLDYAISNRKNGGIPVGKISSIAGQSSTGKSLFAIHLCAEAQKMGGLCIYLDPENALNHDFARRVGLDVSDDSFYCPTPPPPTVEALWSFLFNFTHEMDEMKKKGEFPWKFVLVIWDSIASTPCKADVESENPDPAANVGLKPRIISKNATTYLGMAARKDIALVCLNQLRNRINVMPGQDPWVEPGGNAIPFYASVRLRISSTGKKKLDEEIVGVDTEVKVLKTRFGPPMRTVEFPIYFTHGIDDAESVLITLEKKGGIQAINGGSKGKQFAFLGENKENAIKKQDWKKLYLTDQSFKSKAIDALDKVMTRDMSDPRLREVEDVNDDESPKKNKKGKSKEE